jgi:hypothetical protein
MRRHGYNAMPARHLCVLEPMRAVSRGYLHLRGGPDGVPIVSARLILAASGGQLHKLRARQICPIARQVREVPRRYVRLRRRRLSVPRVLPWVVPAEAREHTLRRLL